MRYIKADTFKDLYIKVMEQVYGNPDFEAAPRGQKVKECLNAVLELGNPCSNLFKCPTDKSLGIPTAYTKKEMLLYLKATDDVELFSKASPFWATIVNKDNKTINSAYGNLVFNPSLEDGRSQFEWAFDCLKKDKDSRQAFIRFNNTSHQYEGVKDLPCTFIGIFHIRENKLNFTIMMRSNDIVLGLIHDLPSFTLFQYLMYLKLKEVYPDLQLGSYTHIANSLHVYERNFELTEKRLACRDQLVENSYPMPNDYKIIKSDDIDKLVKAKIEKDESIDLANWSCPENSSFYSWIMS